MKRLVAFAALAFVSAAAAPPHLLREQAWTPNDAALAQHMTHAPGECLAARTPQIEAGRALFRSPGLLGGPAARAGLSCHACHSNGRVNANFLLPELTSRPGAADVTSEWSSAVRGDGVANPLDIPDLAGVSSRAAFGQARAPSLEHFVHGVIVEEFQGHEPPPMALEHLVAYLRALDPAQCAPAGPITLTHAADDVRRALHAAEGTDEAATVDLVLLATQDAIGRIVERLPPRRFGAERRRLEVLSRELGALRQADDVHAAIEDSSPMWFARFNAEIELIGRRERRTYFNERTLSAALR